MGASAGRRRCTCSALLGIFPDGRKYAVAFGVFYGVMELVPYIGPILGALPPCSWRCSPTRSSRCGSRCCSSRLQQLEGHVVAPQIFGHTLRINPLLVIFALLLGLQLYGIVGALVALPILVDPARDGRLPAAATSTFESWERSRQRGAAVSAVARASERRLAKRYGEREALRDVELRGGAPASWSRWSGPNGAGKTTLLSILAGVQRASAGHGQPAPARAGDRLGAAAAGALLEALGRREPGAVRAPGGSRRPRRGGRADARADGPGRARRRARGTPVRRQPPARERRARADRATRPCSRSTSPPPRSTPASASALWEFVGGLARARDGGAVLHAPSRRGRRYATRVIVLADGELLFDGAPDGAGRGQRRRADGRLRGGVRGVPEQRSGH